MSKRDDDSASDMEVGMTTAERRRRRRRGGGLRVPSDNVPRRNNPPVVAPVPEDPSLAMSIAYSFSSDASEPVPRLDMHDGRRSAASGDPASRFEPIAPDAIPTLIDPPSGPVEQADFEMKTREMTAVDLEELGLDELNPDRATTAEDLSSAATAATASMAGASGSALPITTAATTTAAGGPAAARTEPASSITTTDPGLPAAVEVRFKRPPTDRSIDVDIDVDMAELDGATTLEPAGDADSDGDDAAPIGASDDGEPPRVRRERLRTVALTDEDLEEVREAVRVSTTPPPVQASQAQAQQAHAPSQQPHAPPVPQQPSAPSQQAHAPPQQPSAPSQQAHAPQPSQPQPSHPAPAQSAPGQPPPPRVSAQTAAAGGPPALPRTSGPLPAAGAVPSPPRTSSSQQLPRTPPPTRSSTPTPPPPPMSLTFGPAAERTQPLTALDIEIERDRPASEPKSADDPQSVPELDIQDLAERSAEASGEIEVSLDDSRAAAAPAAASEPARSRTPSTPPATAPAGSSSPSLAVPAAAAAHHPPAPAHHPAAPPHPPPHPHTAHPHSHPPPVPSGDAHKTKAPPTPPPAKKEAKEPVKAPPVSSPGTTTRPSGDKGRAKPWFVDLFDEDYLRTLPFLTPQATQAEAEFVIDAMGLTPGAQVLDVGCGYGRHAMELAARGFHVVGLDLSTPLLVRGGEEAHRRGLQINFVRGDMRELDFESQFDGAYCLFSTFGYFDDETNKKTVANIARALKPGGRVMIEILNRDYLISDLPTRVWWEGDGCVVLEEVELNYFSSRIQVNRSVVFDDGRQLEQEISVRAYSLHEVGKLMHAAGFRVLEVSGGYQTRSRFFGNQSRHIIVVAERKEAT